ncbi:MAG: tetratricopeptide repeat protein [Alphaproteobacteria bacterium]|nr:tetratricopeptide repeat protein [Alphaproteobacteria bacterium]MCB9690189.1 tetratricopeptide repeat protein [Alphaproteobacteria bacterium]
MSERPMHTVPGMFDRLVALYAEGERALAENRLGDADAAFTEAIGLDDHFRQRWITSYAQRAFCRHRMGRLEEAIADYGAALAMNEPPPHQAQYHFQQGMALAALGRTDEALTAYAASIALAPDQPGPRHLRGKLTCETDPAAALADFDHFLRVADHPEVRQLRAFCNLQLGHAAVALPDLERAPDMAWTHYLRAWACAATGDVDACVAAMAETVARDASFARYFHELDDYAAARRHPGFAAAVG